MKHLKIFEKWSKIDELKVTSYQDKNLKFHKGFDKCPCVKKQPWMMYDYDDDGVIDVISPNAVGDGREKRYKPNGVLELWEPSYDKNVRKVTQSKYKCEGDKVIDDWVKNPKKWITYKDTPFVKVMASTSEGDKIIPWMTKDSPGQNYIAKLQKHLIDKGYLKIPKPTGNLGKMTKTAILALAKKNAGEETNNTNGIRKSFYDAIFKYNYS